MKENIKENKKTDTKAQNDLSLLFKYRKFLMGFAALWILMTHEWQIVTNETSFFFVTENFIKRIGFCGVDIFFYYYQEWDYIIPLKKIRFQDFIITD